MVIVLVIVIVTVLVIVMRNSESLILGHLDFLVNHADLADLVDLVVSNKPYLYIESEHHQIMVMRRPLTVPLSLSNNQIMVCDDPAIAH